MEYEELHAVFDPLAALAVEASILHPEVNSYRGLPKPLEKPSNAFAWDTWSKGDIETSFAQADLIIENTYASGTCRSRLRKSTGLWQRIAETDV